MNDLLGTKVKVLDDGYVQLIDVMGDDRRIEDAARISYGEGTRSISKTRGLIRYLMRHRHTTPFEMCEICFKVRVPMDCWRQWIRHRTANVNEYSTRYSEAIDSMAVTDESQWRSQDQSNKQGSDNMVDWGGFGLSEREKELHQLSRVVYKERLAAGVAREQARKDLPLSTYTEAYWKIDLHNMFHFLSLRMDSHAQLEIRSYANAMSTFIEKLFPIAWEAFSDYRLNGTFLTALDIDVITGKRKLESIDNKRERTECKAKLTRLGLMLDDKD